MKTISQIETKKSNGNTAVEKQSNPKGGGGESHIKRSIVYLNWQKKESRNKDRSIEVIQYEEQRKRLQK